MDGEGEGMDGKKGEGGLGKLGIVGVLGREFVFYVIGWLKWRGGEGVVLNIAEGDLLILGVWVGMGDLI